jgi:predicted RNA-binding protein with PUA domain
MGVVKRDGKWRLEKKQEGVYLVTERGEQVAKIITGEYEPSGPFNDERNSLAGNVIEVKNFKETKKEFRSYVEGGNSGGFF